MTMAAILASGKDAEQPSARNLLLRVVSAAVLAPLAIGVAYFGGWPFAMFWTARGDRGLVGMDAAGASGRHVRVRW